MTGARDIARVLDSRIRHMLHGIQPAATWPAGPTAFPVTGSADLNRYLRELADAMDDRDPQARRTRRRDPAGLGTPSPRPCPRATRSAGWTGNSEPAWSPPTGSATATTTPTTPSARNPPRPAPKPAPPGMPPSPRSAGSDGIDLRGCTDGDLWLRRSTYERETAWAPPHVTEELRLMRTAERDAHVSAIRADHETRAAQRPSRRPPGTGSSPRSGGPSKPRPPRESDMFAAVQDTRRQWEAVTETTRTIAIAADAELRRRHPGMQIEPLRPHPAEGDSITRPVDPEPVPQGRHAASSQRDISDQLALGLTLRWHKTRSPPRCYVSARTPGSSRPNSTTWPAFPCLPQRKTTGRPASPGQPSQGMTATQCSSHPGQMSSRPPGSWSITGLHNEHRDAAKLNRDDDTAGQAYRGFRGHRTRARAVSARHHQASRAGRGCP